MVPQGKQEKADSRVWQEEKIQNLQSSRDVKRVVEELGVH